MFVSWAVAIGGIVVGIIALVQAKKFDEGGKRKVFSIIGLVLSALALIATVVVGIFSFAIGKSAFDECGDLVNNQSAYQKCMDDFAEDRFGGN